MPPDEAGLIWSVLASPDDELPGLVYADWLDEHGHPDRAEYLRLLRRLQKLDHKSPERVAILPRFEELERATRLPQPPLPPMTGVRVYDSMSLFPWVPTSADFKSWSAFENHAQDLFTAYPLAYWRVWFDWSVKRRWRPNYVRRFASCPALARVVDLDMSAIPLGTEGTVALAGSPFLASVARINLSGCKINDDGATALSKSPGLEAVRYLALSRNPISESGCHALRVRFGSALVV